MLRPIFDEIQFFKSNSHSISFQHVYRERNEEADGLSKAGLQLDPGSWHIQGHKDSQLSEYLHPSFY